MKINNLYPTMKKQIVLLVALLALPMATFAQSIFDKFEESDNVTTVVVTKKSLNFSLVLMRR